MVNWREDVPLRMRGGDICLSLNPHNSFCESGWSRHAVNSFILFVYRIGENQLPLAEGLTEKLKQYLKTTDVLQNGNPVDGEKWFLPLIIGYRIHSMDSLITYWNKLLISVYILQSRFTKNDHTFSQNWCSIKLLYN